jgi:hypothetical protein
MNIVLDLFLTFAKIGLFTFGGGYAMISLIENGRLLHVTDPLSMLQVLCPQFRVAAKFVSTFRGTV